MATEYLNPTSVTTPSVGGSSCSGSSTARSCTAESECHESLDKATADHKNFSSPSYQAYWSSATLKVDWKTLAQASNERSCENGPDNRGEYRLKYSLNGGSTWFDFSGFPRRGYNTNQTGTVSLSLSTGQDISKVQVRINCQADGTNCPTGACCYGANYCSCRIDTEAACEGYYLGDGTSCTGACDFPACGGEDPFPPPV